MFELKTIEISKTGALTHTSKLSFLIIIKKDWGVSILSPGQRWTTGVSLNEMGCNQNGSITTGGKQKEAFFSQGEEILFFLV